MPQSDDPSGHPSQTTRNLVLAVLVALIILVMLQSAESRGRFVGLVRDGYGRLVGYGRALGAAIHDRLGGAPAPAPPVKVAERVRAACPEPPVPPPTDRKTVREALNRLYSTADVDPLVTGQLYAHNDQVRHIYAQRTAYPEDDLEDLAIEQASCRSAYGLTEYNSSWGSNMVGVDIGPYGLDEYAGLRDGYDDGVPEQWNLPSTPIRWYKPHQEDYYDPSGLEVYSVGLYALSVPDHDPLVG